MRSVLLALIFGLSTAVSAGQSPVLSYDFDSGAAGPAVNAGSGGSSTMPLNGLTLSGASPNGTTCLQGDTALAIYGGDSGWITNLASGVTIAFCIETSGHPLVGTNAFAYLCGDQTAGLFRCFTDGVAGPDSIMFRGGGLADTLCPNSHGTQGWTHVAFVYDATGESRAYVNGSRVNTVAQPAALAIVGTGTFRVGGYSGSIDSLDTGQFMESFRLYDTALTDTQINQLAVGCITQTYSLNSGAASFAVNGVSSSVIAPGQVAVQTGASFAVTMDSNVSPAAWDLAYTLAPTVSLLGGGLGLPGGQIVNVDLADPSLSFFNNVFASPWGGVPVSINVTLPGGTYGGQFAVTNPASAAGYSLGGAVDLTVAPCLGSDFDQSLSLPPGWSTPGGAVSWTVDASGTPSVGTGPTAALSQPNYLYCETSSPNSSASFGIDTCTINFATLSNYKLDFDLSRIGATMGTLTISLNEGGTLSTIATYSGADPNQFQNGPEWSAESIDLLPFIPASGAASIRFGYTAGGSYTGDVALDNLSIN
ncbi:MAG: hypothetical protein CMJ90_09145 [Planctomycetes bacterium]|nr:hypothetical protein [Planctomycetota bacterium]